MSETHKSYRIKTDIGSTKNEYLTIDANLLQDYDTFDILSVKIDSVDTYKLHNANYGVVVGRVLANNGFGIPNAKLSIFVEVDESDDKIANELYSYSTSSSHYNGIRYNLLPNEKTSDCHQVVGTFPNKRYALDNDVILEVFDKYYKYTTRTNNSGDYLIMGVPVGAHTLHMDLDLSDCGILSQRPRDFVYKGYTIEQFENPNMFKGGTSYSNLSQVFTQDQIVNVQPFWGDTTVGEKLGITRADIDVAFKFEPTCVFIGSVISDNSSQGISKRCIPTENMGNMEEMNTGEGTIEMIRKTPGGSVEEFQVKGTQLINGNGVWCYQIPMNLDYVMTDEYGNIVPTDDPSKGIPTRTRVRFRISMQDNEENIDNFFRPKVLVPHNPQILNDGKKEEYDYEFGTATREDSFRDLFWNNVYSVKSYIPRFQKRQSGGWKTKNFSGIKNCNFYGSNNPMPYNNIRIRLPFMFTIMCALTKIMIAIVSVINFVIAIIGDIMADIGNTCWFTSDFWDFWGVSPWCPFRGVFDKACGFQMTVLKEGLCPDLENWYFSPILGVGKNKLKESHSIGNKKYHLLTQTLNGLSSLGADNDTTSLDYANNEDFSSGGESICLTTDTTYLISCIELNLAMEYKVINFDFYNDWINGTIYFPRFMRYLRPKITFLGIRFAKAKIKGCMDDPSVYSNTRRYTQQCAIGHKAMTYDNKTLYADLGKLPNKDADVVKANNLHKKRGFIQKGIFGERGGVCHDQVTSKGHHVYYMKPCEWVSPPNADNVKINLFATDLILLGSLNERDLNGVPQAFKYLSSTSYIIPTNLALTNMENAGHLYVKEGGTICNGKSTTGNKEGKIGIASTNMGLSGELKAMSGTGDSNYDVEFESGDLGDIIALTEAAGIAWNYTGPGQGAIDKNKMYYPGGHFLGLTCINSETNLKTCINLSRICEVGANMSQRKDDVSSMDDEGNLQYTYTAPTGFISGSDIVGANFRSMFATMNHRRLLATKTNPLTSYKIYDFEFLKPINFNGAFKNIVDGNNLYNGKVEVPEEDVSFLNWLGILLSGREDYDENETENTQTRTIETPSIDYYLFRYGLNYEDLSRGSTNHLRKFGGMANGSYYLPQYENSYYFYFGLKNGATALDEFNKEYFSVCENGVLLSQETALSAVIKNINMCHGTADVVITTTNISLPYDFVEYESDVNPTKTIITNGDANDSILKMYSFTLSDLPWGTYKFTIRGANGIDTSKTVSVCTDMVTCDCRGYDFNTSTDRRGGGSFIEQGGYITIENLKIENLPEGATIEVSTPSGSSVSFSNGTSEVKNITVKNSGEHSLYVSYQCEANAETRRIFFKKVEIKNGSSLKLMLNDSKELKITTHGKNWWGKATMYSNARIEERTALFKENGNGVTTDSKVRANGGTKVIWGLPQNSDRVYTDKVYCSEDNIIQGYTLDDEFIYWPTYKYNGNEIIHHSAIVVNNDMVMGNYDAWIGQKTLTSSTLTNGCGYVFKPLPEGELQYGIYNNGYTYDNLNNSITKGVFYPSISYPIYDKPFYAKTNFFVWQDKNMISKIVNNAENIIVESVEMAGKTEMKVYNGITYNNKFFSSSTISNISTLKYPSGMKNDINNGEYREIIFSGYNGGSITSQVSGETYFSYEIINGCNDVKNIEKANRIYDSKSSTFKSDLSYELINVNGEKRAALYIEEDNNDTNHYFICVHPKKNGTLLKVSNEKYLYYSKQKDLLGIALTYNFYVCCKYTKDAYYDNEGEILTLKGQLNLGRVASFQYPIKNQEGNVISKNVTIQYDKQVTIAESLDVFFEQVKEIEGVIKYELIESNSNWADIIEIDRKNAERGYISPENGIFYGVGVDTSTYKNENTVLYKIYPNITLISNIKESEYIEIKIGPQELTFDAKGGDANIKVSGGTTTPWLTSVSDSWITITPNTNVGEVTDATVKVSKTENDVERKGYIDFYTRVIGDGPRLTIKQRKTEQITETYEINNMWSDGFEGDRDKVEEILLYSKKFDEIPYELEITTPSVIINSIDEDVNIVFTMSVMGVEKIITVNSVGTYSFDSIIVRPNTNELRINCKFNVDCSNDKGKYNFKFSNGGLIIIKN